MKRKYRNITIGLVGIILTQFLCAAASAETRYRVDSYGSRCITEVNNTYTDIDPPLNDPYRKYEITFSNGCDNSITVKVTTGAGWEGYVHVPGGGTKTWYCTDNMPVNRDCNGINSWSE